MPSPRNARLAQQLQQEIATIILQELKDPRLGFVTITRVELSNDLAHAKVFYSCLGTAEERLRSEEALVHSTRFIHGVIKKRLRLKIIPEILFRYDESILGSLEINRTLDRLNVPPWQPGRAA